VDRWPSAPERMSSFALSGRTIEGRCYATTGRWMTQAN
jgi:hypothetical protein